MQEQVLHYKNSISKNSKQLYTIVYYITSKQDNIPPKQSSSLSHSETSEVFDNKDFMRYCSKYPEETVEKPVINIHQFPTYTAPCDKPEFSVHKANGEQVPAKTCNSDNLYTLMEKYKTPEILEQKLQHMLSSYQTNSR